MLKGKKHETKRVWEREAEEGWREGKERKRDRDYVSVNDCVCVKLCDPKKQREKKREREKCVLVEG